MTRWMKRAGYGVLALLMLFVLAAVIGLKLADRKAQRRIELPPYPLALREDAAAIDRGRYLFASRGCADCHGANAAGRVFIDDAKSGLYAKGPNIGPGPGSVVTAYQPADWERSIRHGVAPGGRPLMVMPSEDYNRLTDDDLAALVAYLRQLPPVAGLPAELRLPPVLKLLYATGVVQDAAERIDHTRPPQAPIAEAVSTAHGGYVANMCMGCHGPHLSGGKVPGGPPDWPAAANLTPGDGSAMPRYASAEQFKQMLRSGRRPDGSAVDAAMPFTALAKMNDVDADALYLYLKSLPPRPAGGR